MKHTKYRVFEAGSEGCYIKPDTGDPRQDLRTIAHVGYGTALEGREIARLFAASPDLLKALKVAAQLLQTVTIRQVFELGTDAVNAVGLNPWCMNEGRASGDETISLDFIHDAIAKAEEG